MRIMTLTAVLVLLAIGLLHAAVPPLPDKALREGASLIVTGVVTKVTHVDKAQDDPEYVNREYTLTIRIDAVEKGKPPGESVVAHTWQPWKRPSGWAGPQGQNEVPTEGKSVRAHLLKEAGTATYTLMLPNGLEVVEATTKPAK
jgi:hypothetical protein